MATELKLNRRLDTGEAMGLVTALRDAATDDLTLDAGAVDMLGAQCLEVLLSARALWSRAGKTIHLTGATDHLIENLQRFGLSPEDLTCGDAP